MTQVTRPKAWASTGLIFLVAFSPQRSATLGPTRPVSWAFSNDSFSRGGLFFFVGRRDLTCGGVAERDPGASLRWRLLRPGAPRGLRLLPRVDESRRRANAVLGRCRVPCVGRCGIQTARTRGCVASSRHHLRQRRRFGGAAGRRILPTRGLLV